MGELLVQVQEPFAFEVQGRNYWEVSIFKGRMICPCLLIGLGMFWLSILLLEDLQLGFL